MDTPLSNSAADWQIYIIQRWKTPTLFKCWNHYLFSFLLMWVPFFVSFFLIFLRVETKNTPTHRDHHFREPRKVMCGKFLDLRQQMDVAICRISLHRRDCALTHPLIFYDTEPEELNLTEHSTWHIYTYLTKGYLFKWITCHWTVHCGGGNIFCYPQPFHDWQQPTASE